MPPDAVPPEIRDLADARSDARRARDWATADRLKDELATAGWKVVDAASLYTLERAAPPDVEVDGSLRYGSAASVPSRLDDAPIVDVGNLCIAGNLVKFSPRWGEIAEPTLTHVPALVIRRAQPISARVGEDQPEPLAIGETRELPGVRVELEDDGCAVDTHEGMRRIRLSIPVAIEFGEIRSHGGHFIQASPPTNARRGWLDPQRARELSIYGCAHWRRCNGGSRSN